MNNFSLEFGLGRWKERKALLKGGRERNLHNLHLIGYARDDGSYTPINLADITFGIFVLNKTAIWFENCTVQLWKYPNKEKYCWTICWLYFHQDFLDELRSPIYSLYKSFPRPTEIKSRATVWSTQNCSPNVQPVPPAAVFHWHINGIVP